VLLVVLGKTHLIKYPAKDLFIFLLKQEPVFISMLVELEQEWHVVSPEILIHA
jgi:hypothetical protein